MRIGTICSGIGAPEKALKRLGIPYELEYFCEIDKFAVKSYCAIHGESGSKNLRDLIEVNAEKLPKDLDLIVGGTPCQDFSTAGSGAGGEEGSGTRSSLMWNFVNIIRRTYPRAVRTDVGKRCRYRTMIIIKLRFHTKKYWRSSKKNGGVKNDK